MRYSLATITRQNFQIARMLPTLLYADSMDSPEHTNSLIVSQVAGDRARPLSLLVWTTILAVQQNDIFAYITTLSFDSLTRDGHFFHFPHFGTKTAISHDPCYQCTQFFSGVLEILVRTCVYSLFAAIQVFNEQICKMISEVFKARCSKRQLK